jgi:uncharacterized protein (UPF0548 family)
MTHHYRYTYGQMGGDMPETAETFTTAADAVARCLEDMHHADEPAAVEDRFGDPVVAGVRRVVIAVLIGRGARQGVQNPAEDRMNVAVFY